jgi:short-subunit dehydrogenase
LNSNNKVVIITGASSGIGEATAYAFAKNKYNVVLAARSESQLQMVQRKCIGLGAQCIYKVIDVAEESACHNLIDFTIQQFGKINVLINNAGLSMRASLSEANLDVLQQLMNVNFWGTVQCTKYALPYLLKEKGSVIGISSVAGLKGLPGRTGYSASKFAMNGFLEALRIENLNNGLHIGILAPGYTASNIRNVALNANGTRQKESPLEESKLMQPEEVAQSILEMVNKRQNFKVLTLQGKLVFWLNKFFSHWVDQLVYKTVSKEKDSPV